MTAARRTARPTPELPGSLRAKQRAAIVLAVLSGECALAEASRRLSVSPTRYYHLERQALEGLVRALEGPTERHRTAKITREHVRLEQEVLRLQALVRATQRAVALPAPPKPKGRTRKVAPRARKVIAQLRLATAGDAAASPEQE
jgi:hypothetical protein